MTSRPLANLVSRSMAGGFARHLPARVPAQARGSIAGTLSAAHGDTGLVHAAKAAFTTSMSVTFTVSAIGVLAAAILATLVMGNTKPAAPAAAQHEQPELVA